MTYDKDSISFAPLSTHYLFQNLTTHTFGALTVLGYAGGRHWFCECACLTITKVRSNALKSGNTKSCGCIRNTTPSNRTTHNKSRTLEYRLYKGVKDRCQNPNNNHYANYGGKGVEVRFNSFEEFYAELGDRPSKKHSIDRIDVDGHYEKGNLRWATSKEQQRNRGNNKWVTYRGMVKCLSEWCEKLDLVYGKIYGRLKRGWTTERAFETP